MLDRLRASIAHLDRYADRGGRVAGRPALPLGLDAVDAHLPGGGILLGALHEVAGTGPDVEHGAAAALFVAGILARLPGPVLWVLHRHDLFAPALAGVGLMPDRLVLAEAARQQDALMAMEEGLRHPGLAGVVGEVVGRLALTASRRLQLAAEASGVTAFVLRRGRHADLARHGRDDLARRGQDSLARRGRDDHSAPQEPSAAATRWRIHALPSPPPVPEAPEVPGLARARWRLELARVRGGEPRSWTVEACDAQGRLALAADMADRSAAPRVSGPAVRRGNLAA